MTYRVLCGLVGAFLLLVGVASFVGFFRYHAPGGALPGPIPVGPGGAYYAAFLGCALVGWGGCLLGASRRPELAPFVGTATAVALTMNASYRIVAWVVGDYAALGDLLRVEAAIMLLLALGFVWLRPRGGPGIPVEGGGA
jgi:hypothetical protein